MSSNSEAIDRDLRLQLHRELLRLLSRYQEQGFSLDYLVKVINEWLAEEEKKFRQSKMNWYEQHVKSLIVPYAGPEAQQ